MTWQRTLIGALGALMVIFITMGLTSYSNLYGQAQELTSRVAVLEEALKNQSTMLREIRDDIKDLRDDIRRAVTNSGSPIR